MVFLIWRRYTSYHNNGEDRHANVAPAIEPEDDSPARVCSLDTLWIVPVRHLTTLVIPVAFFKYRVWNPCDLNAVDCIIVDIPLLPLDVST